jgi:adenosylmethionine-8-amino-7-oxononanoate aminotransferase/SAM-dependent methyltransferase
MADMTDVKYWGPFAALRELRRLKLSENNPYDGVSAELMNLLMGAPSDVGDYEALAASCGGPVLELGCGDGRVAIELARRGYQVIGVDLSPEMLRKLQIRAAELPKSAQALIETLQTDIKVMELGRKFPLVILPASSILLFTDPAERLMVFRRAVAHLLPGGTFAFDYITFSRKGAAAIDERVVARKLSLDEGSATVYLGIKFTDDGHLILANVYCQMPGKAHEVRHYLEANELARVDQEELERQLKDSGLVVTRVEVSPLPDGMGERRLVAVSRKGELSYPLWHPYLPMQVVAANLTMLTSGDGCRVRTADDKEYIDASGGLWSTQCGLGHPDIVEAIYTQLKRLSYGTLFAARSNEPALNLARELVRMVPSPLQWAYLTNSGSESVELAIKLARQYFASGNELERNCIAYLDESYHGTFYGSMGVTGLYANKAELGPLLPGLVSIPSPAPRRCPSGMTYDQFAMTCADELERRILDAEGRIAAFILEPVLGSAGVVVPPAIYLHAVQQICHDQGVLLILDEVATGFGRTGRWFASEHFSLRPDIMLLSKGLTSGYLPLGAVLFSAQIGTRLTDRGVGISHGSSHNGNPVCCAAAIETIAVIRREGLVERARQMGDYFRSRLNELLDYKLVQDVRSLGLMLGLELCGARGQIENIHNTVTLYESLKGDGVLAYPARNGLTFMPALTIQRKEIDVIIESLHRHLRAGQSRRC